MRKDDLVQGRKYALRSKDLKSDAPFAKVTFVGPVRSRQCRIRHDENELNGLEEWVPTRLVACAWGERKQLLRDEELAARLDEVDEQVWDRVVEEAISDVMTASGEYTGFGRRWTTEPAPAERYWRRAGLEGSPLEDHPANFVDRHGTWHLSFATAQKAAEAFAAAEAEQVDLYIRGWEERLKAEGFEPGQRQNHDLLREWAPHQALARAWSQKPRGHAAEQEVERLRRLVETAIHHLRQLGEESKALALERGLRGR